MCVCNNWDTVKILFQKGECFMGNNKKNPKKVTDLKNQKDPKKVKKLCNKWKEFNKKVKETTVITFKNITKIFQKVFKEYIKGSILKNISKELGITSGFTNKLLKKISIGLKEFDEKHLNLKTIDKYAAKLNVQNNDYNINVGPINSTIRHSSSQAWSLKAVRVVTDKLKLSYMMGVISEMTEKTKKLDGEITYDKIFTESSLNKLNISLGITKSSGYDNKKYDNKLCEEGTKLYLDAFLNGIDKEYKKTVENSKEYKNFEKVLTLKTKKI